MFRDLVEDVIICNITQIPFVTDVADSKLRPLIRKVPDEKLVQLEKHSSSPEGARKILNFLLASA